MHCRDLALSRRIIVGTLLALLGVLALPGCDSAPQDAPGVVAPGADAADPGSDAGIDAPQVVLAGGTRVIGVRDEQGTAQFLGIPFAQPPVGERRWRRPEPWPLTGEVLDAGQFAPACLQSGSGLAWYHGMMERVGVDPALMAAPSYSEDCLYLNVWTDPALAGPKPVLVFIHGGSNKGGWSYEPNYHGGPLARRGVVLVTVAYRLGVFGWMHHPDMAIANPGLHDLALALEWVHEHIGAFGGDPQRITVSGESAGAANALHLALSPLSGDRIRGVIHQSGGWPVYGGPSPQQAADRALDLQQKLLGSDGSLDALRGVSAQRLIAVTPEVYSGLRFGALEDAESLPLTLQQRVAADQLPALDIVIGSNANESLMYIQPGDTPAAYLEGRIPEQRWPGILDHIGADASEQAILDRLGTGLTFLCPSLSLADALSRRGGRVWVYRFDRVRPGFDSIGAYHGAELPYVFDRHDDWLPTEAVDRDLTETLVGHWLQFLHRGDPNGDGLPSWPRWREDDQQAVIFSEVSSAMVHPDLGFCALLSGD